MNDLTVIYNTDEDLEFHSINKDVFEIFARYKGHALYIQPTLEDAKKIRDWLNDLIIENQE